MPIRFTITDRHAPEIEALGQALARHNDAVVGPSGRCMLAVLAEAANEKMIAGLWGHTAWGWLYTRWLWVDPAFRSRGIATELLNRAETEAVMRGCTGAHIDTFSPQALNLYQRNGYRIFGTIPNFVDGRTRCFLSKRWV